MNWLFHFYFVYFHHFCIASKIVHSFGSVVTVVNVITLNITDVCRIVAKHRLAEPQTFFTDRTDYFIVSMSTQLQMIKKTFLLMHWWHAFCVAINIIAINLLMRNFCLLTAVVQCSRVSFSHLIKSVALNIQKISTWLSKCM